MKNAKKVLRKITEKATLTKIVMDQKGGPGLEEAALLVFIGVVVFAGADGLGTQISGVFTKVTTALTNAFN